ncbi:hypothetical protein FRC02_000952 [Tulasnella sp. 418]|nr:hypothetical protein FRC02_000952 [Tulasnella sp. 418]
MIDLSFNFTLAKQSAFEGQPDTGPPTTSSSNLGVIAGSIAGGISALTTTAALTYYLIKKLRSTKSTAPSNAYIQSWSKGAGVSISTRKTNGDSGFVPDRTIPGAKEVFKASGSLDPMTEISFTNGSIHAHNA